ncbi:MAG: hypothetical protein JRJ87_27200 [Deltaproteobacteria bacterium]|nr:hypothetical protein [Deltaproteobacteria bacterium]
MAKAARVMNLMSGILIMASGLYIQLNPATGLSAPFRLVAGLAGIVYFGYQLYRFLVAECTNSARISSIDNRENFGLDFIEQ